MLESHEKAMNIYRNNGSNTFFEVIYIIYHWLRINVCLHTLHLNVCGQQAHITQPY